MKEMVRSVLGRKTDTCKNRRKEDTCESNLQGMMNHSSSSSLGARGPGQTARKGAERHAGFNEGSAWRERHYSLPLEGRSLEASAKRYAPDCQRRDLISLFVVRGPYQDPISKTIGSLFLCLQVPKNF